MSRSRTFDQFEAAFWSTAGRADDTVCWPWAGACNRDGYGVVSFNGRIMLVHRVAWVLTFRQNIAGLKVRHTCPTHACCNPAHLTISI